MGLVWDGMKYPNPKSNGKIPEKIRIESIRLRNWDYGANAAYFITICCHKRRHFFGHIENGIMHLNTVGNIAHQVWAEITGHFHHVHLGEFIIMPNHVHGIIIIDKPDGDFPMGTGHAVVETGHALSLPSKNHPRFRNQGKNTISAMVGSFKSAVTRQVRPINPGFGWQSRFYDHIIRSQQSHHRISQYIRQNPLLWTDDRFFL